METTGDLDEGRRIAAELRLLSGGVIDTSTLIYLERLDLLDEAARSFSLLLIPQVIREYGSIPGGMTVLTDVPAGPADKVLWQMARQLARPVLSEDRRVLAAARAAQIAHYNTLMLLFSLLARGELDGPGFARHHVRLLSFARYSLLVKAVGETVLRVLETEPDGRAGKLTGRGAAPGPGLPPGSGPD